MLTIKNYYLQRLYNVFLYFIQSTRIWRFPVLPYSGGWLELVYRLAYNSGVVAFKIGRRQGGPSRTGVRGPASLVVTIVLNLILAVSFFFAVIQAMIAGSE
jgi:hypothetical protein